LGQNNELGTSQVNHVSVTQQTSTFCSYKNSCNSSLYYTHFDCLKPPKNRDLPLSGRPYTSGRFLLSHDKPPLAAPAPPLATSPEEPGSLEGTDVEG